jgi:hypothetical protein
MIPATATRPFGAARQRFAAIIHVVPNLFSGEYDDCTATMASRRPPADAMMRPWHCGNRLERGVSLWLMDHESKNPAFARAPRYPLRIQLKYRPAGDPQWREGRTENISRSGVLFRTDHLMPLQTPIEMLLSLPAEVVGGDDSATVICRGRVVRTEPAREESEDDSRPAVAATIAGYRLAHSQGNDPRRI